MQCFDEGGTLEQGAAFFGRRRGDVDAYFLESEAQSTRVVTAGDVIDIQ